MRKLVLLVLILAAALVLAACGGGGSQSTPAESNSASQPGAAPSGDAAAGKALFEQQLINGNAGCVTCHSLEAGKVLVGPSLAGIASRAGSTVEGEDAQQYLHQSIVDPNAHLATGCNAADPSAACATGLMPQDWAQKLSEDEINNLIAYLMTLK
ncbi:MAG: cytochrome c [Caldilineae bacterium]|nr:cytochrome c [Anaerolineae bacterium]MCB0205509.1 cytochrome c [Anaerolineae bacterium]MCB9153564.1 cytochrome c [Caldilineae bacterium]